MNDAAHTGLVYTPSNNLPVTVGVIVGTGVALTVGVVIFIFILRYVKHLSSLLLYWTTYLKIPSYVQKI